ncbi:MAG: class I SAM-dependent methyltransferase [Candidatus Omnitrophica bacterium]|nr:class I SAM-dependent methyltransferase [Candidatus Omnitrophota bacterium]MBU4478988.1 class I SAM-dependent methyltransferase [Candidatus Omnitrophota bacterium]
MKKGFFKKLGFHYSKYATVTPVELTYCLRSRFIDKIINRLPFANEIKSILYQYPLGQKYVIEDMRINERIIEYPLVFANLGLPGGEICDLGSAGSRLPLELASLGYRVVGVDHKPQHFVHPNLLYTIADILHLPFADRTFDCVLLISTIEHIGLGAFSDPQHTDGDFKAMVEARRIVKDNGRVLVSFLVIDPTEEHSWHGKMHHYTQERQERLFRDFIVEKRFIFNYKDGSWIPGESAGKCACFFFVLAPR